jgi:hypothetical protein
MLPPPRPAEAPSEEEGIAMPTRLLIALALPLVLLLHHPAAADLLVSSAATNQVLRYDGITGAFIDAFVSAGSGGLESPSGLTLGPDGNLYVSGSTMFTSSQVLRYDGTTGAFLKAFVPAGRLLEPKGLTFGPTATSTSAAPSPRRCSGTTAPRGRSLTSSAAVAGWTGP